jgi:hypothetical protein
LARATTIALGIVPIAYDTTMAAIATKMFTQLP